MATQTCSRRTALAMASLSPVSAGSLKVQLRAGPWGTKFWTARVMPAPMRSPSRSTNQASRLPVRREELVSAPQYLRGRAGEGACGGGRRAGRTRGGRST